MLVVDILTLIKFCYSKKQWFLGIISSYELCALDAFTHLPINLDLYLTAPPFLFLILSLDSLFLLFFQLPPNQNILSTQRVLSTFHTQDIVTQPMGQPGRLRGS